MWAALRLKAVSSRQEGVGQRKHRECIICKSTLLAVGAAAAEGCRQQAVGEATPPRRHLLVLPGYVIFAERALADVDARRARRAVLHEGSVIR